jgi:hypothetical protein
MQEGGILNIETAPERLVAVQLTGPLTISDGSVYASDLKKGP